MKGSLTVVAFFCAGCPGTKPPAGVSAQIRQGGTRKVYQEPGYSKPFIMKKLRGIDFGGYGVFMRKKGVNNFHKKGRKGAEGLVWKGVKMLFGASPIQSLLKKENQQQIVDKASEVFPRRLQHEVNFQIGKLAASGKMR